MAEELHFAGAAERLHIDQSPLSRTIKELEEELGAHLFLRSTRSTQLTRAGRLFLEHVPRVFSAADQAHDSVKSVTNGFHGQLRIALSDGITPSRLPALLARSDLRRGDDLGFRRHRFGFGRCGAYFFQSRAWRRTSAHSWHANHAQKAIATYQDDDTVSQLLSQPLTQVTSMTKTDPSEVLEELKLVRERGYATCLDEIDEGLAAVGVPLMLGRGDVIFSPGITGPYARVVQQGIEKIASVMARYAVDMAAAIAIGFEKQRGA